MLPVRTNQENDIDLSIVLPCLNEAPALNLVFRKLRDLQAQFPGKTEVIFIDDGSIDETPNILSSFDNALVLRHESQKGYGAALKNGFSKAQGQYVLFLDADGTYDPLDCLKMYEQIKAHDLDMVFGTRLSKRGDMSVLRWCGNTLFILLIRLLFAKKITDSCTGFRLFHRRCLPYIISIPTSEFNFSIIMSLKMVAGPFKFSEVEISYGRRLGASKLNWINDGISHVVSIFDFYIKSRILGQNVD